MFKNLKEWLNSQQKIDLGKQILGSVNVKEGLNEKNRQKLMAFLELTDNIGFSSATRVGADNLSSIIGHLDDRPLVVTRNLVSILLIKDSNDDKTE